MIDFVPMLITVFKSSKFSILDIEKTQKDSAA